MKRVCVGLFKQVVDMYIGAMYLTLEKKNAQNVAKCCTVWQSYVNMLFVIKL